MREEQRGNVLVGGKVESEDSRSTSRAVLAMVKDGLVLDRRVWKPLWDGEDEIGKEGV